MPRPRFEKLAAGKREQILETAAKAFAAHGYDGASLNQILADAGISKGAAYYYFDNKADLYMTTLTHYAEELLKGLDLDFSDVTAVTFWPSLQRMYEQQFIQYAERPWVFGVAKSGGPVNLQAFMQGELGDYWQDVAGLLENILRQGIALGVIRDDLPEELLFSLVLALDEAHDRWLVKQMPDMTEAELQATAAQMVSLLQKLLSP